jgi:uncharacterized Ntn-hydrolase superfamily protein
MKQLFTVLTLAVLFTSCGRVESPIQLLNVTEDSADKSQLDDLAEIVDSNTERIEVLESLLEGYENELYEVSLRIDDTKDYQDELSQVVALNVAGIVAIETRLDDVESKVTVSNIIDPCGDDVGYFDEMVLQLSDGTFVAYFENGNDRFITTLPNGNYRTTDHDNCSFSIVDGVLVD